MPPTPLPPVAAPRKILLKWCARHSIGPAQLAAALHCDYKHAWAILRGNYPITLPLIGRLLIGYGVNGPAPDMAAAFKAELERQSEAEREATPR